MPRKTVIRLLMASDPVWAMQPRAFSAFAEALASADEAQAKSIFNDSDELPAPYENIDGVAVIPIEGMILRDSVWGFSGLKNIGMALDSALADPLIKAILFSIHSPGGVARGVKELGEAIFQARMQKPCAAFVDGLCASAAYWLAASTGRIYAGPSSEVGSIGVILRHMDKSGWNKECGFNFTYVTAGAFKAVGHPDAPLSDNDLAVLQGRVNAIYEMFCMDVAQYMGLALENRLAWADGRDFLAQEAEELGLVTALTQNRADAIRQLLKETNMDRTELAQKHPDLLASIERDAVEAAGREHAKKTETAVSEAVANTIAIMETACGKETADKVRNLVATGMTPDQLAAAAKVFGTDAPSKPESDAAKRDEMLNAIKQATPPAVREGVAPEDDANAMIQRIGKM